MAVMSDAVSNDPIKLRARSAADLALLSGLLQDALICGADMTYEASEKRFVAVFNRFCWERDGALEGEDDALKSHAVDETPGSFHRIHSGLVIDRVSAVKSKQIDLKDKSKLFNLLSIHELEGSIELLFSGGAALRLKTTGVLAHLKDLGDSWPTKWRPHHGHDAEILAEETARSQDEAPAS